VFLRFRVLQIRVYSYKRTLLFKFLKKTNLEWVLVSHKKLVIWFLGLIPSHTKFWVSVLKFRVGSCFGGSFGAIHT
jgi:hypothetical protein